MFATQYAFSFADDFDMRTIRRRVAERGPLFDGFPGLVQKAFLCNDVKASVLGDEIGNSYAAFYLWDSVEAARAFLLGETFRSLSQALGRPRVRSWQVVGFRSRGGGAPGFAVQASERLGEAQDAGSIAEAEVEALHEAFRQPGLHSLTVAIDPYRWELVRFSLWREARDAVATMTGNSRGFEVLYLAAADRSRPRPFELAALSRERAALL